MKFVDQDNKQEIAYKLINEKIESGEYPPGMLLVERKLAADFEMSRTPVRAALQQLALENELVEAVPHLGIAVKRISLKDVEEIYEMRSVIEFAAVRSFIASATPASFDLLESIISKMEFSLADGDLDTLRDTDARFHQFFLDFCGNSRINKIFKILVPTSRTLRNICFKQENNSDFLRTSVQKHRAYADAIKNKDIAEAQRILIEMTSSMTEAVISYMQD